MRETRFKSWISLRGKGKRRRPRQRPPTPLRGALKRTGTFDRIEVVFLLLVANISADCNLLLTPMCWA